MARDDAPPFARGETWYNGGPIDTANLGGTNIEGKEFVFEANSQDNFSGTYSNASTDPAGRPIRVKVVRNVSGINLLPGRVAHYEALDDPYETRIDGYCFALADRPAGVVDEFLPLAGVPNNDLFYIVVEGPTLIQQGTSPVTTVIGGAIVPEANGASSKTDTLGGRFALQDLSGATATLGENLQNRIGYAGIINSTANASVKVVVHLASY